MTLSKDFPHNTGIQPVTFAEAAEVYCARQMTTAAALRGTLALQKAKFNCDGWMLLECHMMDSSWLGSLTLMPFGPNNTYKAPVTHPLSPRGLASDTSLCIAVIPATEI